MPNYAESGGLPACAVFCNLVPLDMWSKVFLNAAQVRPGKTTEFSLSLEKKFDQLFPLSSQVKGAKLSRGGGGIVTTYKKLQ